MSTILTPRPSSSATSRVTFSVALSVTSIVTGGQEAAAGCSTPGPAPARGRRHGEAVGARVEVVNRQQVETEKLIGAPPVAVSVSASATDNRSSSSALTKNSRIFSAAPQRSKPLAGTDQKHARVGALVQADRGRGATGQIKRTHPTELVDRGDQRGRVVGDRDTGWGRPISRAEEFQCILHVDRTRPDRPPSRPACSCRSLRQAPGTSARVTPVTVMGGIKLDRKPAGKSVKFVRSSVTEI